MAKNSEKKLDDLASQLIKGIKLAHKRMIKSKIEKNQSLVLCHNGKIVTIKASEFHTLK